MGIDVNPGSSPRSKRMPFYSVVILNKKEVLFSSQRVPREEIKGFIEKYGVRTIAVDNIRELFQRKKDLYNFMMSLPNEVAIIQVTGSPKTGFLSIKRLAEIYKLKSREKSSYGEAWMIAKLALKRCGCLIAPFGDEVRIIVSRTSKSRKGGSRGDKWRRSEAAAVLNEFKYIKDYLEKLGLEYEAYTVKTQGGLSRALFIVYEGFKRLKLLKRLEHHVGVHVKVEPVYRKRINYIPLSGPFKVRGEAKPIMIGIDPGMSIGLSIFDLNGNLLLLKTLRRASISDVVDEIIKYGKPVLLTSDVSPPPKALLKLASIFGAKIYTHNSSLSVREKWDVTQRYCEVHGVSIKTSHERDSLAALIKAYNHYKNLWSKAASHIEEVGLDVAEERFKKLLIEGYSISKIIEMESKNKQQSKIAELKTDESKVTRNLALYRDRLNLTIIELRRENERLRKRIEELNKTIEDLKNALEKANQELYAKIKRDRFVKIQEERIKTLEEEIKKLKTELLKAKIEIKVLKSGTKQGIKNYVETIHLAKLSRDCVEDALNKGLLRPGSIIVVDDASGAGVTATNKLIHTYPKIVFYRHTKPANKILDLFRQNGIIIHHVNDADLIESSGKLLVDESKVTAIMGSSKTESYIEEKSELEDVIKRYKEKLLQEIG